MPGTNIGALTSAANAIGAGITNAAATPISARAIAMGRARRDRHSARDSRDRSWSVVFMVAPLSV